MSTKIMHSNIIRYDPLHYYGGGEENGRRGGGTGRCFPLDERKM